MTQNFRNFYNNWTVKVENIIGEDLTHVYDKYITSFVIYNNLYSQIPEILITNGTIRPQKIFDNKAATEFVIQFLGSLNILNELVNNTDDIKTIIDLIQQETFYIKLKNGKRQRKEDLKILAALNSDIPDKKAIAILQALYYVRCNLFHGQKDFQEYQRLLVEPLTNILTVINRQLYNQLNN